MQQQYTIPATCPVSVKANFPTFCLPKNCNFNTSFVFWNIALVLRSILDRLRLVATFFVRTGTIFCSLTFLFHTKSMAMINAYLHLKVLTALHFYFSSPWAIAKMGHFSQELKSNCHLKVYVVVSSIPFFIFFINHLHTSDRLRIIGVVHDKFHYSLFVFPY